MFDRRFNRDVTFLFSVINGHYYIEISNKLIFCKDRSTSYNLRKNGTQDLVPNFSRTNGLKYSFLLTVLLMNEIVYLITLENQIVLKLLKRMLHALLRITRTSIFIVLYNLICYILIAGGIPCMVHQHFWLSPSPHFFSTVFINFNVIYYLFVNK